MHTFCITKAKLMWFELLSCLLVTHFPAPPIPGSQLLGILLVPVPSSDQEMFSGILKLPTATNEMVRESTDFR